MNNDLTPNETQFLDRVVARLITEGHDPEDLTSDTLENAMRDQINREAELLSSRDFRRTLAEHVHATLNQEVA